MNSVTADGGKKSHCGSCIFCLCISRIKHNRPVSINLISYISYVSLAILYVHLSQTAFIYPVSSTHRLSWSNHNSPYFLLQSNPPITCSCQSLKPLSLCSFTAVDGLSTVDGYSSHILPFTTSTTEAWSSSSLPSLKSPFIPCGLHPTPSSPPPLSGRQGGDTFRLARWHLRSNFCSQ